MPAAGINDIVLLLVILHRPRRGTGLIAQLGNPLLQPAAGAPRRFVFIVELFGDVGLRDRIGDPRRFLPVGRTERDFQHMREAYTTYAEIAVKGADRDASCGRS